MRLLNRIHNIIKSEDVQIKIIVPKKINRKSEIIKGSLTLFAKSDQYINKIELKLTEKWTAGRGIDCIEKIFTLGEQTITDGLSLKAGYTTYLTFMLPFEALNSNNDRIKSTGYFGKALGSMGSFLDGEKSVFIFSAFAHIKGAARSSSKEVTIKLTV